MGKRRSVAFAIRPVCVGLVGIVAAISTSLAPASATSCSTVTACIFGSNIRTALGSGFGEDAGVVGSALAGDGIDGATHFTSTGSIGKSGVAGFDMSTTGTRNDGVFGFSAHGTGVHGSSGTGTGIVGLATTATGIGIHAEGNALALQADVTNGTAMVVEDAGNPTFQSNTGIAVQVLGNGVTVGTDFGTSLSLFAGPMSYGASITSSGGDALDIDQEGSGIPLYILPHGASADEILVSGLFALDPSGNVTISGSLLQNGTPMSVTRTDAGKALRTYAPREAESTIEDVGETSVKNGHATVALDAAFASTIDPRHPYYVFLTAEGDNRGLYVASKTHRGFDIRESSGGSSTLAVQYRVIAKPYDASANPRLPAVDIAALPYANASVADHAAKVQRQAGRARAVLNHLSNVRALNYNQRYQH